jgi:hypothetical protein
MTGDVNDLDYYTQPAKMTSAGRHAALFDPLPHDVEALASIGHGLFVHEHLAHAYGLTLSDEDRASVHTRPVGEWLERITTRDSAPLDVARPAELRLAADCRHFTVLIVAMLRAQGVAARARCGFGDYFGSDAFEDHWVCEYWNAGQERWILVDAQIDARQRELFPIDFDVTDVPRDRFLVAGEAWAQCRAGEADPGIFGLSPVKEFGSWWIAGNLMRDVAALNNVELLPWDCWGVMPGPQDTIDEERTALFDRLAALTRTPDAAFAELRNIYQADERIRVPSAVRNAIRDRVEMV